MKNTIPFCLRVRVAMFCCSSAWRYRIRTILGSLAIFHAAAGQLQAADPVLDQSHIPIQSVGGTITFTEFELAQTFTVGLEGLLSQVDLQLGRAAGTVNDVTFEIRSTLGGVPDMGSPLFQTMIPLSDIPIAAPGNIPVTSVDLSGVNLPVAISDVLALVISRAGDISDPTVFWNSSIPAYGGGNTFTRLVPNAWGAPGTSADHGFQTWVAPFTPGDFNRNGVVGNADLAEWELAFGLNDHGDADDDGYSDGADFLAWQRNFQPALVNGDFETVSLPPWTAVVTPNGNVTSGFPRVELFDVDGDGQASQAMRTRVGQQVFDSNNPAGGGIEQLFTVESAGDYSLSADIASSNIDFTGNTGPGRFELFLDGSLVDVVDMNGILISPGDVLRDTLSADLINLSTGSHTVMILVTRTATNSREIYQYVDNVLLVPTTGISDASQAVPEPSTMVLFLLGLTACGLIRRRCSPTNADRGPAIQVFLFATGARQDQ